MTHLPYIVAAYVFAVGLPLIFTMDALLRMRAARRQLVAVDPRHRRLNAESDA